MEFKIIKAKERKLVGMRLKMSLTHNKTVDLFQAFMPRKKEIKSTTSEDVFALQHYDLLTFTPQTIFEKWACTEVTDYDVIPEKMDTLILEAGMYAVFIHKGNVEAFVNTFKHILYTWLPNSKYILDDRPHFEILGDAYLGPNNPNSKEEIWIPIR
jgi:AraC family transcriptional regulator